MENLNYCRQAVKSLNKTIKMKEYLVTSGNFNGKPIDHVGLAKRALLLIESSVKFTLPIDGISFRDNFLQSIDESTSLNLPFDTIALEYIVRRMPADFMVKGEFALDRYIVIASKLYSDIRNCFEVEIVVVVGSKTGNDWTPLHSLILPSSNFINREIFAKDGWPSFRIIPHKDDTLPHDVYIGPLRAVLSLINALQCSNVKIEKSNGNPKKGRLKKALGFDEYNVLTVINTNKSSSKKGGSDHDHRSPREHLRRGHIRRLASGITVWVNAAVINAGIGAKIHKSYAVK